MKEQDVSNIRIVGQDDSVWHVHGEQSGAEGVVLGQGQVKGIYDAPIKTVERSPARMDGGMLRGVKTEIRELSLGCHLYVEENYDDLDGRFTDAFAYQPDEWDEDWHPPRIEWDTNNASRKLEFLLSEGIEFDPDRDPNHSGYGNFIAHGKAYDPYWKGETVVTKWQTGASGSASGFIEISNPSNVAMFHRFICTRGNWTLPDVQWIGKANYRIPGGVYGTRSLQIPPATTANGGITVDLDPSKLMVRDAANTNTLAQMPVPGTFFMYKIPPRTPKTLLPVSVTNAPAGGAMVQCVQPRRYRKAWGH